MKPNIIKFKINEIFLDGKIITVKKYLLKKKFMSWLIYLDTRKFLNYLKNSLSINI